MRRLSRKQILILVASIGVCVTALLLYRPQSSSVAKIVVPNNSLSYESEQKSYEDFKAINTDYVGWLSFESGLVDEPVVQCKDNQTYLNHNFNKEEEGMGTVFLDKNCSLDSKNITVYGHYVYYDPEARFTPLSILSDETNVEENRFFTLKLEKENRKYEIAYVLIFDMNVDTEYPYMTADFLSDKEFDEFIQYGQSRALYSTDVKIESQSSIMTLQTCVRNEDTKRLLIIGKEIERYVQID